MLLRVEKFQNNYQEYVLIFSKFLFCGNCLSAEVQKQLPTKA